VAPPFIEAGVGQRLANALPAVLRATELLFWPASLSVDYGPQVIPFRTGVSAAAVIGGLIVLGVLALAVGARKRAPAVSFAALAAAVAYLPSSNLLFASGIVLSERDLYLPVILPATLFGAGVVWALERWPRVRVLVPTTVVLGVLAGRGLLRLPAWTDNRTFLVTLLADHPESAFGQQSAAAVFAGMGRAGEARAAYARADSLFGGNPRFAAGFALFLVDQGDTAEAARLVRRVRAREPREPVAMRVEYLLARARGLPLVAAAIADTAGSWYPWERSWYAAREAR
jgi:hypothetical protein